MTMPKFNRAAAWNNNHGATAVEFAIVAPVLVGLVVGSLYLCMGLFLAGSLQFAVEEGARCASVNTSTCNDATSIATYARSRYFGPAVSPTFTYAAAACGNSVSASVNYVADLGFNTVTIPISATACFP
jgi:Flp pilus assembly protein TadG